MPRITGQYSMEKWNETVGRDQAPPRKSTHVAAHGPMTGEIEGDAQTFYLLAYVTEQTGRFCGYTYFDGRIGDLKGTFVLADDGHFDAKSATTEWTIVPGSGTGDFEGISGSGGFVATHGLTVEFALEYRLPG